MVRVKTIKKSILECPECGIEVYACDECSCYFEADESIECADGVGEHYCIGCAETIEEEDS